MALPPRKWYSLEQAAKKLTLDTGKNVTVDDLLYFANKNLLQLCVYVDFSEKSVFFIDGLIDYRLEIDERNTEAKIIIKNIIPYKGVSDILLSDRTFMGHRNCPMIAAEVIIEKDRKRNYISKFKGLLSIQNTKFLSGNLDENIEILAHSRAIKGNESFNNNSFLRIPRNKYFPKNKDRTLYINYICEYKEPQIEYNTITYLLDEYCCQYTNSIIKNVSIESLYFTISKRKLYITDDELELLKAGGKFLDLNYKIDNKQNGRPASQGKQIVIEIAKLTAEKCPSASRAMLSEVISEYLSIHNPELSLSVRTINELLKEHNIGCPQGRQRIKTSDVIDPFKD